MIITRKRIDIPQIPFEFSTLLTGDQQIGSKRTDYDFLVKELETARRNKDRININGDLFDNIFWTDRKRFRPSVLPKRLQGIDNAADATIDWGIELYEPYKDLIDVVGSGNHDDALVKHHHTDPIKNFIKGLNHKEIKYGGYCGWLCYCFYCENKFIDSLRIFYHHGVGGSAPVSRGLIDFHRTDTWIEGADVIWFAHKHKKDYYPDYAAKLSRDGTTYIERPKLHIQNGAYMHGYVRQSSSDAMKNGRQASFEEDRRFSPQAKGGFRLRLVIDDEDKHFILEGKETISRKVVKKDD